MNNKMELQAALCIVHKDWSIKIKKASEECFKFHHELGSIKQRFCSYAKDLFIRNVLISYSTMNPQLA